MCEQVTKSFLWLGLAINNNDAKVEFDDAKFAFSKNLLFFAENSKSANTKIAVQNLIFLWSEFKILLEAKPSKENAMIVINKSNLIMNSCSELISKIYFENNIKNTRILNLCNKQKLNIEKISKYSVIKNWNFGYPELEKDLNKIDPLLLLFGAMVEAEKELVSYQQYISRFRSLFAVKLNQFILDWKEKK